MNCHALPTVPVYKKNRIASLQCIFETTIKIGSLICLINARVVLLFKMHSFPANIRILQPQKVMSTETSASPRLTSFLGLTNPDINLKRTHNCTYSEGISNVVNNGYYRVYYETDGTFF